MNPDNPVDKDPLTIETDYRARRAMILGYLNETGATEAQVKHRFRTWGEPRIRHTLHRLERDGEVLRHYDKGYGIYYTNEWLRRVRE